MDEFSDELQEYILNIVDVQVNEKCGSRVIAVALGQGQEFGFLFTKIWFWNFIHNTLSMFNYLPQKRDYWN